MPIAGLLASFLSPKGIAIMIGTLIIGFLLYSGYKFEKNYVALVKANTTLTMNLQTSNAALAKEKQSAQTQEALDQTNLDSVRKLLSQQALQLQTYTDDNTALLSLRTPTDADFQCSNSIYVSTELNRMRQRDNPASTTTSGTSPSNASPTSGTNDTPTVSSSSSP